MESDSAQPDTIKNYLAGGGSAVFATNGTPDYSTGRRLSAHIIGAPLRIASSGAGGGGGTPTSASSSGGSGASMGGGSVGLGMSRGPSATRSSIGGSDNLYGFPISFGVGISRYFLTNRMDRYGRVAHYGYTNVNVGGSDYVRLTSMKDKDGRTNTLSYTNTAFPRLITSVTDPYNRTAHFIYDNVGRLTNITDMASMSSSFKYDSSGAITNMVTPYGTNSFRYFHHADIPQYWSRGLEITEPTGEKQLSVYHDGYGSGVLHHMHSYHWNRKQYAALSAGGKADPLGGMTSADFRLAPRTEWLRTDSDQYVARVIGTPFIKEGPVDSESNHRSDIVNFSYPDLSGNVLGGVNRPSHIWWGSGDQMGIPRNSWGRPTEIKYFRNLQWVSFTNEFNADGRRLEKVWGPNGEQVRGYGFHATNTNLLTSVTNALGDVIRYTHDANVRVTSITHPSGLVTTNIYYDSGTYAGFLKTRIDVGFRTNHYTWINGNLEWHTNELGLVTKRTWDNLNRLTSISYPDDSTTVSNTYNNLDLVGTKDRLGHWTTFGYNPLRQMVARTNANNRVTEWDWCNCGSPSQITEWNGSTPIITQYNYDIAGRLTNVVYPDLYAVNYKYDNMSRVSSVIDPSGRKLHLSYTNYNQLRLAELYAEDYSSGGQLLSRTFDEYGRLASATDRSNVETTFEYDVLGRMTNRTIFDWTTPSVEQFTWTARGMTNHIDELGRTNWFVHDALGRLLYKTNAENQVLRFTYNPADQLLTLTDGKDQMTKWNYDFEGRVTNKVDQANTVVFRYKYDADSRLTNRWTAAKGDTFYSYDPIGNLTSVDYPGTLLDITLQYDPLDRLTNMLDAVGTTKFTYTDAGQLLSEDGPWANDTVSYGYTHRQRTLMSVLQPNASPWTQSYGYDGISRLSSVASAAGNFDYGYLSGISDRVQDLYLPSSAIYNQYDPLARLTNTILYATTLGTINRHGYQYNEAHQRTKQMVADNNVIEYTYDKIGQLKTAKGTDYVFDLGIYDYVTTPRLNEQFGYSYDAAWNLERRTNNALVQTFGSNSRNELTNATRSGTLTVAGTAGIRRSQHTEDYGVTNVTVSGNGLSSGAAQIYSDGTWARTNATLANGQNIYTAVAQDSYNRSSTDSVTNYLPTTVTYQYDGNGNLTNDGLRVLEYDYENQLTNVYVTGEWRSESQYDGLGRRRVRKDYEWRNSAWVKTDEVRYVYDERLVVQERDANNLPRVSYTRGDDLSGSLQGAGGIGGLLARTENSKLITQNSDDAHAYYHADGNGNVTMLVSTNGAVLARYHYDPYGNMLAMSGPLAEANTIRFSSKEFHAKSGLYYYLYRFYDPNLQRWVNRDPIEEDGGLNLFQFARNAPQDRVDLWGLEDCQMWSFCENQAEREQAAEGCAEALKDFPSLSDTIVREFLGDKFADWLFGDPNVTSGAMPGRGKGKTVNPAKQFKKLTPGEIKKLQDAGKDPHDLKPNSKYDLFKDKDGNVCVMPKDGSGPGDPTGINLRDIN